MVYVKGISINFTKICKQMRLKKLIRMKKLNSGNFYGSIVKIIWLMISVQPFMVTGQQVSPDAKQLEEKFYQARKVSSDLVKKYYWESRTDVTREGKVVEILIEQVRYGPDGKQERKIINDQEAKLPSSFLIHQVAEDMKAKMISFMNNLHLFLEGYALEDQNMGTLFFSRAVIGNPDPEGQILVSGGDVLIKGDRLQWWIDSRTYSITKASIATTFDGDQIEFTATYKNIPSGVNYLAFAEILVPAKSVMVQLH
jgi:hypothetical protein